MVAHLPNITEEEENMDDGTPGVDVDIEDEEEEKKEEEEEGTEEEEDEEEGTEEEKALDEQTTEQEMEGRCGPRSSSHNLRPRRRPSEEYRRAAMQPHDNSHLHASLEHYAMTQYSIKKGLEVFGDAGKEAVLSEMKQLHDMGVVEPKKAN
jgi:hypothetical protein